MPSPCGRHIGSDRMLAVVRNELRLQRRDGRLALLTVLLVTMVGVALLAGWNDYRRGEAERIAFSDQAYRQWVEQAPKHPHRAASFGLYVSKPEGPLAVVEPGLRPFAGRTLWLEAHNQASFSYAAADDAPRAASGLGERSGAGLLQLFAGLLALVIGALSVARERETGVLRQLLAQGVRPTRWITGKYTGLLITLAIPMTFVLAAMFAFVIVGADHSREDALARLALMALGLVCYLATMLAVGMLASVALQSSRAAFAAVLAFWIVTDLLAPRVASHLAMTFAAAPTAEAYEAEISKDFGKGLGGQPGWAAQLTALEAATKKQYGVATLDVLPVGFSGLRMLAMEDWSNFVGDRHFARLSQTYVQQDRLRDIVAFAAPFLASRSWSQAMAGTDWSHYRHFADEGERYRRVFNRQMNELIVTGTRGQAWEMVAGRDDFAKVPPMSYRSPTAGWAAAQAIVPGLTLLVWLVAALTVLLLASRRLRP